MDGSEIPAGDGSVEISLPALGVKAVMLES